MAVARIAVGLPGCLDLRCLDVALIEAVSRDSMMASSNWERAVRWWDANSSNQEKIGYA